MEREGNVYHTRKTCPICEKTMQCLLNNAETLDLYAVNIILVFNFGGFCLASLLGPKICICYAVTAVIKAPIYNGSVNTCPFLPT